MILSLSTPWILFLTEIWLEQNNSAAVLIESTPPGYSFISEARVSRRGGGVAVLFNESFHCKQLSPGSFQSLYMAIQLKASPRVLFLSVYRPPKYCADFSDDLSELLSMICVDFDCVIIVGDFNIHMDNP